MASAPIEEWRRTMESRTPLLDAHRRRLTRAFSDFVVSLGPQEILEICGEGSAAAGELRAAGRLVHSADVDALPLGHDDGSIDVVLLRDVLSAVGNPAAVLAEAWRVARRCVVLSEAEYVDGVASQSAMNTLNDLVDGAHPLDAGDMLALLPEQPAAVDIRSFGALTVAPPHEVDAIIEEALGAVERTDELEARACAVQADAAGRRITYPGSRVLVAYKSAPVTAADGERPDPVASATGEVSLRMISPDTIVAAVRLHPAPAQVRFVAPNAISLAQAAVSPHAWFRAVAVGETTVGFVMVSTDPGEDDSPYLWRFMIDARHQGRGAGRRAIELVCDHFASEGATALHTGVVEGPGSPRPFYESLGFVATGAIDEGETVLRRPLG